MFPNFRNGPPWDGPLWLTNPTVTVRAHVMMAMGMVSVATGLRLDDALASLRAHAYAVDRTVDSIAQDTVHRNLSAASLSDRRASAFRIHRCPYLRCDFPNYLVRSVTEVNGFVTVLPLTSGWNPGPQRPTRQRISRGRSGRAASTRRGPDRWPAMRPSQWTGVVWRVRSVAAADAASSRMASR
jgi:hypothetical protein